MFLSDVVRVMWDNGNSNVYRHGAEKAYDLRVVDEPRKLAPGENIKVGVKVKRGKAEITLGDTMINEEVKRSKKPFINTPGIVSLRS